MTADPLPPGAPFFQADTYVGWVRGLVGAMRGRLGAVGLFDASLREPGDLLREVVDRVFAEPGRPRMRSVMDAGNPLVVERLASRYGVDARRVLCTTGALSGVGIALRAFVGSPQDHVLVERPHLDTLVQIAQGAGARVGFVERCGVDARLDPERLRDALRPDTRLVVLTNLHNPTGAYLDEAALRALDAAMGDHPAPILVDEVYVDFVHRLSGGVPAAVLSERFISVSSLSKVYGLGALKCGWIVAARPAIDRIAAVQARDDFGVSKLTHAAASIVLEEEARFTADAAGVLAAALPVAAAWALRLSAEGLIDGAPPTAGCLFFPRLVGHADTRAFAARLWERHGVAVAPGELFGRPGHVRIGFGRDPGELARALDLVAFALREAAPSRAAARQPHASLAGQVGGGVGC